VDQSEIAAIGADDPDAHLEGPRVYSQHTQYRSLTPLLSALGGISYLEAA
jgi:hypothetical protein